jgi:hypothetical protein
MLYIHVPPVPQTLEYAMLGGAFEGSTLWMVQQMCNHGTLIEAGELAACLPACLHLPC